MFVGAATLCLHLRHLWWCASWVSHVFFCTTCMRTNAGGERITCHRIRAWEVEVCACVCVRHLQSLETLTFRGVCVCLCACLLNLVGGKRDSILCTAQFGLSNAPNPIRQKLSLWTPHAHAQHWHMLVQSPRTPDDGLAVAHFPPHSTSGAAPSHFHICVKMSSATCDTAWDSLFNFIHIWREETFAVIFNVHVRL